MNKLDKQYTDLLKTILEHGIDKKDRTGTGTKSIFGYTIRHNMKDGFPLLTTKKMPFKTIVTELLWFLRGDTNIKYLIDNGCNIWTGDAYMNYRMNVQEYEKLPNDNDVKSMKMILDTQGNSHPSSVPFNQEEFINKIKTDNEFAKNWGDLGPIYGKQWRNWGERKHDSISNEYFIGIDQIQNLINDLKTNPDSRRLMVNAWNVGELDAMVLPPCHYGFQVYTRELSLEERNKSMGKDYAYRGVFSGPIANQKELDKYKELFDEQNRPTRAISLMWNQRSVDTFLGLPFNIASYGLLLEIIAKEVNMVPDELIGNLGDVHLYSNHIEQAKEQIGRDLSYGERWNILKEKYGSSLGLNHDRIEQEVNESTPARTREPFTLPKLVICDDMRRTDGFKVPFDELDHSLLKLIDYQSHPSIKAPLSN